MSLLLIIPWLIAGAVAWYFTETNGSQLKKYDAKLYDELKDDKDGKKKEEIKKNKIPALETEIKAEKEKIEEAEKKLKNDENDSSAKTEKETAEKELKTKQDQLNALQSADKMLVLPVLSMNNLLWFGAIFLGIGLVGHMIMKWIIKMFFGNDK